MLCTPGQPQASMRSCNHMVAQAALDKLDGHITNSKGMSLRGVLVQ